MPPTYADFKQRSGESVGTQHTQSIDVALGLLRTAAVSFEHLTGNEYWDRYLSNLQELLNVATKERARYQEYTLNVYNEQAMREGQCKYHEFDAQVKLLQHIMGLPYEIINSYARVKQNEKSA